MAEQKKLQQTDAEKIAQGRKVLEDLAKIRGGTVLPFHRRLANDPKLIYAFEQQYINCNKGETVIPRKYRELMIMLLGCATGVPTTIKTHARLASENGASLEEVGEALRMAFLICGVQAVIPASEIFEELT